MCTLTACVGPSCVPSLLVLVPHVYPHCLWWTVMCTLTACVGPSLLVVAPHVYPHCLWWALMCTLTACVGPSLLVVAPHCICSSLISTMPHLLLPTLHHHSLQAIQVCWLCGVQRQWQSSLQSRKGVWLGRASLEQFWERLNDF